MKLLEVKNLSITFQVEKKIIEVVHNLNFNVNFGEILCLVGESGCGKTVSSLALMDLLPSNGCIKNGQILFENFDLLRCSPQERHQYRGKKMGMIFQEPMSSLNPVLTVAYQMMEPLRVHKKMSFKQAWDASVELLDQVRIAQPEKTMKSFPHELSGGMSQRIMIAMILASKPQLLIADEPTTALDVSIQAQILDLLIELCHKKNMGVLFITHDMGVVSEIADRVVIMYGGQKMEEADTEQLIQEPQHPYTQALMNAVPQIESPSPPLPIPGNLPARGSRIKGCPFHPRCPYKKKICTEKKAPLIREGSQEFFCWKGKQDYVESL